MIYKNDKQPREPLSLEEEIIINESAHCKIIGICIEPTRCNWKMMKITFVA